MSTSSLLFLLLFFFLELPCCAGNATATAVVKADAGPVPASLAVASEAGSERRQLASAGVQAAETHCFVSRFEL